MRRYSSAELEILLNWDGLHCKPPFRTRGEELQHYARYIDRMLWAYLSEEQWKRMAELIGEIRVDPKLKRTTEFLLRKHQL